MIILTTKPGIGEFCTRCGELFTETKAFAAFIDPLLNRGALTLYGAECCKKCAEAMQRMGTILRTHYATTFGIKELKLDPVHLCLVSWSSWCPKAYAEFGILHRPTLTAFINSQIKGVSHGS
ncbi:hypothetical protein [Neptunomonas antarctica]|uniref:Uncharacterized protein n=1 Tax=Neptunomonas antarctica TaxID=619304 RepID=A0A1N7J5V1_9GAMM|nr:hypothetical protein [Neptunomonas antarctica]SIS44616.1 hypothetical protein SAMN05421760_101647 [Neptunomonas antarctica]